MGKYYGKIGFATTSESVSRPGVWEESIVEKYYYGDVIKASRKIVSNDKVNDDILIENRLSIIMDPYISENVFSIKYVEFMGSKLKVSDVDLKYPRMILKLGGLYNV